MWRVVVLAIVALVAWISYSIIGLGTRHPLAIDAFGLRTMKQLGYPEVILAPANRVTQSAATYLLPANASQGPANWYIIRLHFRLELAERNEPGLAYVSAFTNDRSAAQIEFELFGAGDHNLIYWNTLDVIEGRKDFFTFSPSIEVYFTNYLQMAGVVPGTNALSVSTESYGGIQLERLTVFDDTGIEYTPLAPPKLATELTFTEQQLIVGDTFRLGFRLKNRGNYPAKGVNVQMIYPRDAMRIRNQESWRFPVLEKEAEGEFDIEALQPGQYQLIVIAGSQSGGQPVTTLDANIGLSRSGQERKADTDTSAWTIFASAGLSGLGLLFLTKNLWSRR